MKTRLTIVLLTLLFIQCCLAGQVRTMSVTGRVIDYQARPVEGATVICYELRYELGSQQHR